MKNIESSVKLTTRIKHKWLELIIENGNTVVTSDVWLNELQSLKENLESVIDDINYLIEKK